MNAPARTIPAPGIYPGMPFDEYLAIPAASASALKVVATCPAKLGVEREATPAMQRGTIVHCAVLEPFELEQRYAVTDLDRRGTKAWVAEEEAAGGRELVKRAEWDEATAMRDAVWSHPVAAALLEGAEFELTLIWIDAATGVLCKARIDIRNPSTPVDLKTAADGSPAGWSRAAVNNGYYLQATHYRDGCRACGIPEEGMPFIVVESAPPHIVTVYDLDPQLLSATEARRIRLLQAWREAMALRAEGQPLPGYLPNTQIHKLTAPAWALATEA